MRKGEYYFMYSPFLVLKKHLFYPFIFPKVSKNWTIFIEKKHFVDFFLQWCL